MSSIGTNVSNLVMGVIGAVILLLVGIALGPTVIAAIVDINATALATVPMGSVIVLMAGYIPFFYYLGITLGAMVSFWGIVKYSN